MHRACRSAVLVAALVCGTACRRGAGVQAGLDAGVTTAAAANDLLCWQQSDGCVFCWGRDGESPFVQAEHSRPSLCDPLEPDNCVEFCSALAPDCALPWVKGPGCVFDSELAFRRALFDRDAADRAEVTFAGRVVDEANRRMEGARVGVWVTWRDQVTHLGDEVSGRDGQFRVRLRTGPWTYSLRVSHPTMASEFVDRLTADRSDRPGQPGRLFRLGPEQPVRGKVVDGAGAAVPGARVQALRGADDAIGASEVISGDDGAFALGGLGPRRYSLRVSKFGWRPSSGRTPVTAPAGRIQVKLVRANVIRGIVKGAEGAPEPSAIVAAVLSGMPGVSGVPHFWMAEADGRFAQDQFPVGTYYVWARRGDMLLYPPEKIELAPNQEGVELELTLRHKGARVSGRVQGQGGYRLGRDSRAVLLSRSPLSFPRAPLGELDSKGRFVIGGVLPGRYEIAIRDGARALAIVKGSSEVEVPIEPDSAVVLTEPIVVRPQTSE